MATKIIKLNNGLTGDSAVTYVPVTVASAVQYSYDGGVMSVQDAIGTIASTVVSSNHSISDEITDHKSSKDYLSYDSTNGFKLSGIHGTGNVKMVPGTGISFSYTAGGALTISAGSSHASGSDNQHLSASATNNVGTISLDGSGGNVTIGALSNPASKGDSTAHVAITYNSGLKLNITYTDTNTVFKGSADASSTTTASTPSQTNGMIGVIQKVASTNGTSFTTTQYVGVPSKDYVDSAIDSALTSALKYQGTIAGGSTGNYGALTPAAKKGDVYVVSAAGKINGISVEAGDTLICKGDTDDNVEAATSSNYATIAGYWNIVNGENQVEDKAETLTVPYTTTASSATTIATVDGTNITLKSKHAAVTYTSSALTALTPAHGGNFTVIGNVEVNNGHVTKLHTQKVTLPSETQLSKTGTNKTATLTHGGTFTYISNINVSNHAITYDYTTATLPSAQTIPNLFQTIANNGTNLKDITTYGAPLTAAGTATAETTSDTLNVYGSNYWIRTNVTDSSNTDVLTIGHALSAAGAKTTADVYSIKIDAAGHITAATAAATGTVGLTSMKYKVGNTVDDIDDAALGLTFGNDLNVAELTGDTTFVK